jgi:hypothetical protein
MNSNGNGYWDKKKEKLKEKYPVLTDKDLGYTEGKEQEMMEIIGYKLQKSKIELLEIIVNI